MANYSLARGQTKNGSRRPMEDDEEKMRFEFGLRFELVNCTEDVTTDGASSADVTTDGCSTADVTSHNRGAELM